MFQLLAFLCSTGVDHHVFEAGQARVGTSTLERIASGSSKSLPDTRTKTSIHPSCLFYINESTVGYFQWYVLTLRPTSTS